MQQATSGDQVMKESTARAFDFPVEAYRKLRNEQSAGILAAQLETFASRVKDPSEGAQSAKADRTPRDRAGHFPLPDSPIITPIFTKAAPYTSGNPNPEYVLHQRETTTNEAYGDPVRGRI